MLVCSVASVSDLLPLVLLEDKVPTNVGCCYIKIKNNPVNFLQEEADDAEVAEYLLSRGITFYRTKSFNSRKKIVA